MLKLRISCRNALFGLEIQMAVGDTMVVAVASATGVFLR